MRATLPFSNFSEAVNAGVVRAANDVWAVGDTGHVWHSTDGMTFSEATIGADVQLMGIASHRDGLFVVGAGGAMFRQSGSTWQPQLAGTGENLAAIGGATSTGDLFALGAYGTILRRTPDP